MYKELIKFKCNALEKRASAKLRALLFIKNMLSKGVRAAGMPTAKLKRTGKRFLEEWTNPGRLWDKMRTEQDLLEKALKSSKISAPHGRLDKNTANKVLEDLNMRELTPELHKNIKDLNDTAMDHGKVVAGLGLAGLGVGGLGAAGALAPKVLAPSYDEMLADEMRKLGL